MEPLFALVVVFFLLAIGSKSESYSEQEKPFTLERNGRYITIKDRHSNQKMIRKFVSAEEASRWYLSQNEYLENPQNNPRPRRAFYLTRK